MGGITFDFAEDIPQTPADIIKTLLNKNMKAATVSIFHKKYLN